MSDEWGSHSNNALHFDRLVPIIRNLDLLLGQVVACSQVLASTMGFWSSIASALLGRL